MMMLNEHQNKIGDGINTDELNFSDQDQLQNEGMIS